MRKKTLKTDALGSPSLLPRRASILGLNRFEFNRIAIKNS